MLPNAQLLSIIQFLFLDIDVLTVLKKLLFELQNIIINEVEETKFVEIFLSQKKLQILGLRQQKIK